MSLDAVQPLWTRRLGLARNRQAWVKLGGMMAIARMNVPAIYVYAGTIKPGKWKGVDLTVVSVFEAVGAFSAGRMSQEDYDGIERNACPSVGACGGMFTANTMSSSFEALGMSLMGSSQMASPDQEKADSGFTVPADGGLPERRILVGAAGLLERRHVQVGDMAPDHLATEEIGPFSHGVAAGLVLP